MLCGHFDEPSEEASVLDKRRPLGGIPDDVFGVGDGSARLTAEEHDDGLALCGDETEEEDILGTAVVAFWRGLAERGLGMQTDLFVFGADEVVDNVGARGGTARVAEPLVADETFDYAGRVEDATVGASVFGQAKKRCRIRFISDAVEADM